MFESYYDSLKEANHFQIAGDLTEMIERELFNEFDVANKNVQDLSTASGTGLLQVDTQGNFAEIRQTVKDKVKGESPLAQKFKKGKLKPFMVPSTLSLYPAIAEMPEWLMVQELIRVAMKVRHLTWSDSVLLSNRMKANKILFSNANTRTRTIIWYSLIWS